MRQQRLEQILVRIEELSHALRTKLDGLEVFSAKMKKAANKSVEDAQASLVALKESLQSCAEQLSEGYMERVLSKAERRVRGLERRIYAL